MSFMQFAERHTNEDTVMSWVKLDDHFSDRPKVARAGTLAQLLYINALTYASRYLTDGFIPHAVVARLVVWDFENPPDNYTLAQRLVEVGLWETVEGGYRIHDYLDYNPSRAEVENQRRKNRERIAAFRKTRKGYAEGNDDVREMYARTSGDVTNEYEKCNVTPVPHPHPDDINTIPPLYPPLVDQQINNAQAKRKKHNQPYSPPKITYAA